MIELKMTLANFYIWIRAFHIISIIAWMAGLLYLPRLFVYHCDIKIKSQSNETFKVMERRLLKAIMTPAMIASLVSGLLMLYALDLASYSGLWLHLKLGLVAGLLLAHAFLARCQRAFARDANTYRAGFYRVLNEVPTLLMIGIVIMVVVRPF